MFYRNTFINIKTNIKTNKMNSVNDSNCTNNVNSTNNSIYDIIYRSKYGESITEKYIQNPIIGKKTCWDPLGNKLSLNEKNTPSVIEANKYFTIRLDGKNFSSCVPKLKRMGIFEDGYSMKFEMIMKKIAESLPYEFQNVLYVYTQSDEITILFDKIRTDDLSHEFSGRRDKLISLISGFVTKTFNLELIKICIELMQNNFDGNILTQIIDNLPSITFDARIGVYDTLANAFELILWRSHDCSVNGLSQAVYFNNFSNIKKSDACKLNTNQKIKLLEENNMLPLSDHQAYGTLIKITHTHIETMNKKTLEKNFSIRRRYVQIKGPIIKNLKDNIFSINIEHQVICNKIKNEAMNEPMDETMGANTIEIMADSKDNKANKENSEIESIEDICLYN